MLLATVLFHDRGILVLIVIKGGIILKTKIITTTLTAAIRHSDSIIRYRGGRFQTERSKKKFNKAIYNYTCMLDRSEPMNMTRAPFYFTTGLFYY